LQKVDSHKKRVFVGDDGSINWQYKEPKILMQPGADASELA